ncbi:MAG: type polyketide synthase [Sphingobacteriales bacterium]|nr:type polyketide synthase [Sphingobacteriales bacterium]
MSSCISAIGIANPPFKISQQAIYPFMVKAFDLQSNDAQRLKKIYDQSGINYRYSVLSDFDALNSSKPAFFQNSPDQLFPGTRQRLLIYEKWAADIGCKAAMHCFEQLGNNIADKITHVITVSCTGMHAPGLDIELVELLSLNKSTERTCINFMGCYGAINALKTADYICRADESAKVLVVSVELCTLHFQKISTLDNWVSNSLFSDGAAAVLIENKNNRLSKNRCMILENFYTEFVPEAKDDMGWLIGDFGFEMKLSSKVSKHVKKHIKDICEKLMEKVGLTLKDVRQYAIHPGGRRILEAAEESLNISPESNHYSYDTLRDFGNMSSATILFVLQKIMQQKDNVNESRILGAAFGPGLTVETMLLKHCH